MTGNDNVKHTPFCAADVTKQRWDAFFDRDWPEHRKEHADVIRKVNEMHAGILAIREDTKHLPTLETIADTLGDMRDGLIKVVSGKNVVDVDTVKEMLKAQQSTYTSTIATVCKIFGMIIIILVGLKLFVPHWFGQ